MGEKNTPNHEKKRRKKIVEKTLIVVGKHGSIGGTRMTAATVVEAIDETSGPGKT